MWGFRKLKNKALHFDHFKLPQEYVSVAKKMILDLYAYTCSEVSGAATETRFSSYENPPSIFTCSTREASDRGCWPPTL